MPHEMLDGNLPLERNLMILQCQTFWNMITSCILNNISFFHLFEGNVNISDDMRFFICFVCWHLLLADISEIILDYTSSISSSNVASLMQDWWSGLGSEHQVNCWALVLFISFITWRIRRVLCCCGWVASSNTVCKCLNCAWSCESQLTDSKRGCRWLSCVEAQSQYGRIVTDNWYNTSPFMVHWILEPSSGVNTGLSLIDNLTNCFQVQSSSLWFTASPG